MIREGRVCGIGYFDILDWTWGEVQEYVSCYYERERRRYQNLSVIAAAQAHVICRTLASGGEINAVEDFPYWTEDEKVEAKIARLKKSFMR